MSVKIDSLINRIPRQMQIQCPICKTWHSLGAKVCGDCGEKILSYKTYVTETNKK